MKRSKHVQPMPKQFKHASYRRTITKFDPQRGKGRCRTPIQKNTKVRKRKHIKRHSMRMVKARGKGIKLKSMQLRIKEKDAGTRSLLLNDWKERWRSEIERQAENGKVCAK